MASRFETVDEANIEELRDNGENENTKNSTEEWENVFKKWTNERNFQANLEEYENDVNLVPRVSLLCLHCRWENSTTMEADKREPGNKVGTMYPIVNQRLSQF